MTTSNEAAFLQQLSDAARIPSEPNETMTDYLGRIGSEYNLDLSEALPIINKAVYLWSSLQPQEEELLQNTLSRLSAAALARFGTEEGMRAQGTPGRPATSVTREEIVTPRRIDRDTVPPPVATVYSCGSGHCIRVQPGYSHRTGVGPPHFSTFGVASSWRRNQPPAT